MSTPDTEAVQVWTIGHGRHEIGRFIQLLDLHSIEVLVDVRTTPGSRWAPHFNSHSLQEYLKKCGKQYVMLGGELGGRPPELEYFDEHGHVLYRPLSESVRFKSGLHRLITGASEYKVAIMCSESDHEKCHRNLLVGRALRIEGHRVTHILPDGGARQFDDHLVTGIGLPGFNEEDPWRSLVQVRPEQAQRAFSDA